MSKKADDLLYRTYGILHDPLSFDPEEADDLIHDIAVYLDRIRYEPDQIPE